MSARAYPADVAAWLADNYPTLGPNRCAEILGKSRSSVRNWAYRRGLKVPLAGRPKPWMREKMRAMRADGTCETWPAGDPRQAEKGRRLSERLRADPSLHPRGMRGKKHSAATRARLSQSNKRLAAAGLHPWQKPKSEEQLRKMSERMVERLKTADSNVYSSARRGYRLDLGPHFFRSRWEANYARYLKMLVAKKVITDWEFESETFWFDGIKRGVRSYTPDFKIWRPDTSHYFVEVKGWMDQKSATKIRRMARYHPKVELQVVDQKAYNEIERKLGGAIPHWEFAKSDTPTYTKEQMIQMGAMKPAPLTPSVP